MQSEKLKDQVHFLSPQIDKQKS